MDKLYILTNFLKDHDIPLKDGVVRFGLAQVLNRTKNHTNDIDFYLTPTSFFELAKIYPNLLKEVPKANLFEKTYKIHFIESLCFPCDMEIFLCESIDEIEKYVYNGLYITTKVQTSKDYHDLGRPMMKSLQRTNFIC